MAVETALLKSLEALGIASTMYEHAPVFTVDESTSLHASIAGTHTKNMFLKDGGGQYWLITMPHNMRADLKALPHIVGGKKMSFGKAEDMERLLGITPGSVTPLAAINDVGGVVKVVLDSRLASADIVNIHPLRNNATIGISGSDLVAFLRHHGHDPLIATIPAAP
jgi:Ala-tRNA(Pro) deacylase